MGHNDDMYMRFGQLMSVIASLRRHFVNPGIDSRPLVKQSPLLAGMISLGQRFPTFLG